MVITVSLSICLSFNPQILHKEYFIGISKGVCQNLPKFGILVCLKKIVGHSSIIKYSVPDRGPLMATNAICLFSSLMSLITPCLL